MPRRLAASLKAMERSGRHPNVLLNTDGDPWNKSSLNCAIRRFRKAVRLPFHWKFQMLRATYGSLLVQEGIPIAHVSMALGHSDVKTTQRWYIGLNSTHVAPEIAAAIGRFLG